MPLSNKQIKQIKKEYPQKSVKEISEDLNLKPAQIYTTLGMQAEMWAGRLENLMGYLTCFLLILAPFIFKRGLNNFADLPQRVFIQAVTVFLMLLWVMWALVKAEIKVSRNPVYLIAAAFVGWSFSSLLWAHNRYDAFYSAVHWATCGAVFFAVSTVLYQDKWTHRILAAVSVAGTGVVFLGLGQHFFKLNWVPVVRPPAAAFANANMASQYVVIVLPIFLCLGFYKRKSFTGYTAWIVAALSALFIFYTKTRASGVAIACALIWTVLILLRRKYKAGLIWKVVFIVMTTFTLIAATWIMAGITKRNVIETAGGSAWYRIERKIIETVGGSAWYRIVVWRNSFEMFKTKPLQGFGAGGFKIFYPAYTQKQEKDLAFDKKKQIRRVHNDYLQTAAELGITGVLLFIAVPLYGLFMAWRLIFNNDKSPPDIFLVTGISSGIVAFMATALFSFPLQRSMPLLIVFIYLGILTVLYNGSFADEKVLKLRVSKTFGVIALMVLLVAGTALIQFNWGNIISDEYFRTAMTMEKKKANSRALEAGLNAHKYNKYRADILSTVGRAYVTTGKFNQGIEVLERATSKYPYHLNALFILGVGYANSGNKEKALETFKRVLKIKPEMPDIKRLILILKTRGKVKVNLE